MVHISEVSNGFVKDIHDVLSIGDEVTVVVTAIGNDGKIGLSIRKAEAKPEEKRDFPKRIQSVKSEEIFSRNQPTNVNKQDFDSLMSSFLKIVMIVYLHYDVIRKVNAAAVAVDVTKQDEQVVKRICDVTISISKISELYPITPTM